MFVFIKHTNQAYPSIPKNHNPFREHVFIIGYLSGNRHAISSLTLESRKCLSLQHSFTFSAVISPWFSKASQCNLMSSSEFSLINLEACPCIFVPSPKQLNVSRTARISSAFIVLILDGEVSSLTNLALLTLLSS